VQFLLLRTHCVQAGRASSHLIRLCLQLVHPVLTFGLLVLTRFALGLGVTVEVADAVGSVEFEVEGALAEEEIDGLLEAAIASVVALGVAGVLVDAAETLLLL
jgi:hypothetical protein